MIEAKSRSREGWFQSCNASGMKRRSLIHNLKSSLERRRRLRRNSTPAEDFLWAYLRRSKLEGKKFRRQHSIGPYIADFYCPECRVIVELDGAGHETLFGAESDYARTMFLKRFNVEVLRFENREVFDDVELVVETIREALRRRA